MPTYNDLVAQRAQMPSLAEMMARMRAKRAAERNLNPGDRPDDRTGGQQMVQIDGEAPIQAQPVRPEAQGQIGVGIGPVSVMPQRPMQLPPVRVPIDASGQGGAPSANTQPDPRGAMVRQLMTQGMTYQQAMQKVRAGG